MIKGKLSYFFLIPILFLAVYIVGQPQSYIQKAEAGSDKEKKTEDAAPTFTSIGDCAANNTCPTPEQTTQGIEPTAPPQIQPQTGGEQPQTVGEQKNSDLISLIKQLIELIKQLLGIGTGGCQDIGSNYAEDTLEANSKGKKKKKNKKGLLKRLKCPDQQQGGSQQSGGQGETNPQPSIAQPAPTDPQQAQPGSGNLPEPSAATSAAPSQAGGLGACTGGPQATEPAHNYTRTTHGGKTVNQRTKNMLQIAEGFAEGFGVNTPFTLSQGSYNTGVAASAGTHDGGGVVDISVNGMSTEQRNMAIRALRMAGFTAWLRSPAEGFAYHIHANAIGDREMASGARNQVTSFFDGRNGLAGNGQDTAPASVGRPIPSWAAAYGTCE